MQKTAEAVSLGHPDKTADYISSYILDRMIAQDSKVRYAVEVMVKDNTVVLGGEIGGYVSSEQLDSEVRKALREIGYDERYAEIWGHDALNINHINVINLIGRQSADISCGVSNNGWGDQGIFVGYACQGEGNINRELFLARKLNRALYEKARLSDNLGLDIKTQVTLDDSNRIETVIMAVPMQNSEDLSDFAIRILGDKPKNIILNGTGTYRRHASIADCGITGRKLACDFYGGASPIGGGSPWTKDPTKADLTLNIYARQLALENLKDNDECFVHLSSCIGKSELPSGTVKTVKNGKTVTQPLFCTLTPETLIRAFGLDKPIYADLCRNGLQSLVLKTTDQNHL